MKVPEGLQEEILRTLYKAYPKPLQVKELSHRVGDGEKKSGETN